MNLILITLFAYLLGSLSFAVLVSKAMGLDDPRSYGSNNPGATNVLRSGSKLAAALTLALDAAKGWVPLAVWQFWVSPIHPAYVWGLALAAIAVFLGHLYPVFFKFKGGKGVATAAGVLLGVDAFLGGLVILTWIAVLILFRYSSLAAICAAILTPVYYFVGAYGGWWTFTQPMSWVIVLMSLLLLYRHQDNLRRLLGGQESQVKK